MGRANKAHEESIRAPRPIPAGSGSGLGRRGQGATGHVLPLLLGGDLLVGLGA